MEKTLKDTDVQKSENKVICLFESLLKEPERMQIIVNQSEHQDDVLGLNTIAPVINELIQQIKDEVTVYRKQGLLTERREAHRFFLNNKTKIEKLYEKESFREIEELLM
jgi:hypothetical protein